MSITTRDLEIIRHLENGLLINAEIASRLVYHTPNKISSLKIAQRRLTELYKSKQIKRIRNSVTQSYIYYIGKAPTKVNHRLMMASFISHLNTIGFEIEEYQIEYSDLQETYHFRPDIFLVLNYHGERICSLVEIDLTKGFTNMDKYNQLIQDRRNGVNMNLPLLPLIIVPVTNQKIDIEKCLVTPIQIYTDFSNIESIKNPFIH